LSTEKQLSHASTQDRSQRARGGSGEGRAGPKVGP